MGLWLVVSKCFNIYINNFSRYSAVYGSIGAIFVFALWINFLSYALLIGGQINAVIYDKREAVRREGQ
jgi:membrane protein